MKDILARYWGRDRLINPNLNYLIINFVKGYYPAFFNRRINWKPSELELLFSLDVTLLLSLLDFSSFLKFFKISWPIPIPIVVVAATPSLICPGPSPKIGRQSCPGGEAGLKYLLSIKNLSLVHLIWGFKLRGKDKVKHWKVLAK